MPRRAKQSGHLFENGSLNRARTRGAFLVAALALVLAAGAGFQFFSRYAGVEAVTITTVAVSALADGTVGTGASFGGASVRGDISEDGRYIAFSSFANNLAAGDVNSQDVLLLDRDTWTHTVVNLSSGGVQGNGASANPSMTPDGRFVAFVSSATNLIAGDTNGFFDVYLRDRTLSATSRVSVATDGTQQNAAVSSASDPDLSDDGQFVTFRSPATNLVAGDTNAVEDVFVRDTVGSTTERVNVATDGTQANGATTVNPKISGDGRYVAFASVATNLVAGDTNAVSDIFVRDRTLSTTTRVSVATDGTQGDASSTTPMISSDGRYVSFTSDATNLVAGDTNAVSDIFVRDLQLGTTVRVSVAADGTQGNGLSQASVLTPDGSMVAFASAATNFVDGDTNGVNDAFIVPLGGGSITRVSVASDGTQADASAIPRSMTPDGRNLVYQSVATNLIPTDTNGASDIFLSTIAFPPTGGITDFQAPELAVSVSASPASLPDGPGDVTYTYVLTNPGFPPVREVSVTDDRCAPLVFVGGDYNGDGQLQSYDEWTYACTMHLSETATNTVTAVGYANGIRAEASASVTVEVGSSLVETMVEGLRAFIDLQTGCRSFADDERLSNPVSGESESLDRVCPGDFITTPSFRTVYYVTREFVRRPFFNALVFLTHQPSFGGVRTVSDATLLTLKLGDLMTPKAGTVLVKFQGDGNAVFALFENPADPLKPIARRLESEEAAAANFGPNWGDFVIDLPPTMFESFVEGSPIFGAEEIDAGLLLNRRDLEAVTNPYTFAILRRLGDFVRDAVSP